MMVSKDFKKYFDRFPTKELIIFTKRVNEDISIGNIHFKNHNKMNAKRMEMFASNGNLEYIILDGKWVNHTYMIKHYFNELISGKIDNYIGNRNRCIKPGFYTYNDFEKVLNASTNR